MLRLGMKVNRFSNYGLVKLTVRWFGDLNVLFGLMMLYINSWICPFVDMIVSSEGMKVLMIVSV